MITENKNKETFIIKENNNLQVICGQEYKEIYYSNHSTLFRNPNIANFKKGLFKNIYVEGPHTIYLNNKFEYMENSKLYDWKPNLQICTCCIEPKIASFISNEELIKYNSIAEIGCRYGSSSLYLVNNCNNKAKVYLYEKEKLYCDLIEQRLGNSNNYEIYIGDASSSLSFNDILFDLVFFDASHHLSTDEYIINQLYRHINEKTLVIFDDYDRPEVKELIKIFNQNANCYIRYKDGNDIITIKNNKLNYL